MALSNQALSQQARGEWVAAEQVLGESLGILATQVNNPAQPPILAASLEIQGQGQLAQGQAHQALQTWQQVTEIYRRLENGVGVQRTQINQAQALEILGMNPRACSLLLQSLQLDSFTCLLELGELDRLSPQPTVILALRSLGNVLRLLGQNAESQAVLLKSWQLAQQLPNYGDLGEIYLSLGNTLRHQRLSVVNQGIYPECLTPPSNQEKAISCYQQAQLSSSPITRLQAQLNLLTLLEPEQEIAALLQKIPPNLSLLAPSYTSLQAELKYLQTLISLQEGGFPPLTWLLVQEVGQTTYQHAQALGDKKAQANALGYLARIAQAQGNLNSAQQLNEQALALLASVTAPEVSYRWQWQLGQIYRRQGKTTEAIALYTLAYNNLQALRPDLAAANAERQFSFQDRVEPVYRELVDLLLEGDNPSQEQLRLARRVLESLQVAELNNFFQEACLENPPPDLENIDPHAAVFYDIVLSERLAVIVSFPGQPLRYYQTRVSNKTVEATFDDFQANLNPLISSPTPLKARQLFYDWLIRPAQAQLAQEKISTLVFVLDGLLRNIPMAALHDGQKYLIEDYHLALMPSLQLSSSTQIARPSTPTLAGGLASARQGFPALPAVKLEMLGISSVVPTTILLDEGFTRDRLRQTLQGKSFPILHLATHGQFSSQAAETFLVTWDTRINVKELDQILLESQPLELLILSACQTAVGDKRAILGLAGMAVRTRARSVVATLWAVQDESTAQLMGEFYRVLQRSPGNKAEALRQAQLSLLRDKRYQHPFYWAAFVLVGNWL
jgi:CHAT domain-containing protein